MTMEAINRVSSKRSLRSGVSLLAAAAAALSASPALAQDGVDEDDAIVVTGTRLVRQDFEAISPVTTVGAEQLELTATLTTDSLLNELPQIVPGNTRTSNNAGGYAYSTVDLRGLGVNRTLVLVNGERVPASSTLGGVDLNTIPASLISRIEVVTGGASAVYGSDALAGVINFVLKDDYEGGEVNIVYGSELETGNAQEFEISGLIGGNFANGRGNMTAYASYYDREGISQGEYDYSRVSGGVCYDSVQGYFVCDSASEANAASFGVLPSIPGGSGTPPWGWITNDGANPFDPAVLTGNPLTSAEFASYDHDCNPATPNVAYTGGNLSFSDTGALEPRNHTGACLVPDRAAGSSRYSYAPDNFLVIPAERIALTTSGHYDITDTVQLNLLINYTNSRTEVQLAPTPATGLTITLTDNMQSLISANHPDLWLALQSRPTPLAPFTVDRRTSEVGARNSLLESNNFYVLTGLEGTLGDNWDWNVSASYGQVMFNTRNLNSVNATALSQGLAGCQNFIDGMGGDTPLGATALPGCVPLDIFGPGTLDATMQSFIRVDTFTDVHIEENRISGFVRGDLLELPAGPVASVFGFEYRDTFASQFNDNEQRTGNIFGFNAIQDQEGQIDVYELYSELAVPLVADAPFADYLGLELGYRRSNYSSIGDVDTYKIGGEWAPADWLRFRAVFNEATRAPSVFELFRAGDQGFPTYVDPCNDGLNNAACIAAPGAAGINPAVYPGFAQNNVQVQAFAFGNTNLGPETAETYTYGFVLQPDWFPTGDFRASVDYFDIEITDVIAALGANFFLGDCYVNGNVSSCARIVRDPVDGQVTSVDTTVSNQGALATSGWDIQLEWSLPLGPGQLTLNELYSILDAWTFNGTEFAGTSSAGIGSAFPDFKSVFSATYNVGDWTFFTRWTYTPEMDSSFLGGFGFGVPPVAEASYWDASVRWNVTESFTLTANVDNMFDDFPPQTPDGIFLQANTDVQVYRPLGRAFTISGRYRF